MPQPVGGTLVFAVNSLFYLNQGIPIYGVSLNSTGDKDVTTDILIKQLEGVKLSLDCAVADFLSPSQLVISLKGGELYVLSLVVDSMRSVKGFQCTDQVCQPAIPRVLVPVEQAWQLSPDQVHQQGGEAGQEGGEGATQHREDNGHAGGLASIKLRLLLLR